MDKSTKQPTAKLPEVTTSTSEELERSYRNLITGFSVASFVTGLGVAFWISRRKGLHKLPTPVTTVPHRKYPGLQTEFHSDPMQEARLFALKTFGLGTLLCSGVFGTLVFSTSWLTGASDLKEFSIVMRKFINSNLRAPNPNPLKESTSSTEPSPVE